MHSLAPRFCRVAFCVTLAWLAVGGALRAESPAMRAFMRGEPVPFTHDLPTPALQVGMEAPAGLEWKPVGNGAWVATSVVLVKPYGRDRGTFLNAYRPANDPKVAVLEFISDENQIIDQGTTMIGTRREADGTENPVRMYRAEDRGTLAVREPTRSDQSQRPVLYRFAVGQPGSITLTLVDGRTLSLKSGDFAAERNARLKQVAARIDPANAGPDWSAIDDSLFAFLELETGSDAMANYWIIAWIEPHFAALGDDLATESAEAAASWRAFVEDFQSRRKKYERPGHQELVAAWTKACKLGGIAERGVFERLGRRALRAAALPKSKTDELIALWREADNSADCDRLLALRAQWRRELRDPASLAALDRAIVPAVAQEIARLQKSQWPGTIAGLALLAHQLDGRPTAGSLSAQAVKEPASKDDYLALARTNALALAKCFWPAMVPEHPETARIIAFLNVHPDFAGNPLQAVLGVRPGAPKEWYDVKIKVPGVVAGVLAGNAQIMPAKDAPPVEWRMVFTNTDVATTTDPLIKQRERVRSLREQPEYLYSRHKYWQGTYEGPRQRLRELTQSRRALEYDQSAAVGAAQKARKDWAVAQQWSWEHPTLVMTPGDEFYQHYVRGQGTQEMASFQKQHNEQVDRANSLQNSVAELRRQEAEALAEIRGSSSLGSEVQLMEDLKQAQVDLRREETVLVRLEAAEARRVFHAGVGEHDTERLEAVRSYYRAVSDYTVKTLQALPESADRNRELQWWRWWLALDQADLGELPAELRPAGYWMPEVAAEIVAEEIHIALGADEIGDTYKGARRALERAIEHANPVELSTVLGPVLRDFRRKLTETEWREFVASLDGGQQLIVSAALVQAAQTKP